MATTLCPICNKEYNTEGIGSTVRVHRGRKIITVCRACYEKYSYRCAVCGETHIKDGRYIDIGNRRKKVCKKCRNSIVFCNVCGKLVPKGSDYHDVHDNTLCHECALNMSHRECAPIMRYYDYRPNPVFYPNRNLDEPYYGIELEVDYCGHGKDLLEDVMRPMDYGFLYAKSDGSLSNGVELVTEPATFDYIFSNKKAWEKVFTAFYEHEGEGASTSGMHVHVSRDAISEEALYRIVFLMDKFYDKICRFACRTTDEANRWAGRCRYDAHRVNEYDEDDIEYNRYRAVNCRNRNTIEFRIFRSTLDWNRFAAYLQFVEMMISKCNNMSNEEAEHITWNDLVQSDYEELSTLIANA